MALWLWATLAVAGAAVPPGSVLLRPAWQPGQVLTYDLTRRDVVEAGSELERTHPGLGGTTSRTFTLRVRRRQPGGGITAALRDATGDAPAVIALFDADGAFVSASPKGAFSAGMDEALRMAFLPGYKRPLELGGTWAGLAEGDLAGGGRYLVDVALELKQVVAAGRHRLARVTAGFSWAGRADPLPWEREEPPELHVDGLSGQGEALFDLDLGVIRHAAHSWRTSVARRASDGPGPAYEVTMGHVETTVTLDLVRAP